MQLEHIRLQASFQPSERIHEGIGDLILTSFPLQLYGANVDPQASLHPLSYNNTHQFPIFINF